MQTVDQMPNNQMAVASLVSGIIAWVIGGLGSCALFFAFPPVALCTGPVFVLANLAAVVTGHMGRRQIRQRAGTQGGDTLAVIGLVLGWLGLAVSLVFLCLAILGVAGLTLLAPTLGDVFSDIVRELSTPQP